MRTPAYSSLYLDKSSRVMGNMLHDAVIEYGMDGTDFLNRFIQCGIATQFENGNPKYIAGKSGLELFQDVIEKTTGQPFEVKPIVNYDRSDVYWVGWMLAHYQWYSSRSFKRILDAVPYENLLRLYHPLHEADITKSYEILDKRLAESESVLKSTRKKTGLSQKELAERSGVSINTIRAYERKNLDLNKARFEIVVSLSKALSCRIEDLID